MNTSKIHELAEMYGSTIYKLNSLMDERGVDIAGLEVMLEMRENLPYSELMEAGSTNNFFPVGMVFSLDALTDAYQQLDMDPERMEEFAHYLDENSSRYTTGMESTTARNIPNKILYRALEDFVHHDDYGL